MDTQVINNNNNNNNDDDVMIFMCSKYFSSLSSSPDMRHISERKEAVITLWKQLKELANARTEALAMAKKIHTFNREADDMTHQITVSICTLRINYLLLHVHICELYEYMYMNICI